MNHKIVTLCGSTRFPEAFIKAAKEETLAGNMVFSVGLFGHLEGIDMDGPVKQALDRLHLAKIDRSDEVLFLNVMVPVCVGCGKPCDTTEWDNSVCCADACPTRPYIGESTRRELEYARAKGKAVRFLNPE